MKNISQPMERFSLLVPVQACMTIEEHGAKAVGLAMLTRARVPVPPALVIPTWLFREALDRARSLGHHDRVSIGLAIAAGPLRQELRTSLRAVWELLGASHLAVRSSSTSEDLHGCSAAGMFLSVLDVVDQAGLEEAVLSVWASTCTQRVESYLHNRSDTDDIPDMAVIIQRQVDSVVSGVAFSRDPVSGMPLTYVEWVHGLGVDLVSGERIDGRAWINANRQAVRIDHFTPPPFPGLDWLTRLCALTDIACHAVDAPNGIDVEWALGRHDLMLLQARPITVEPFSGEAAVVQPWDLPGVPPSGWNDRQRSLFELWDEYNAPVATPLAYDLWLGGIWQANLDMFGADDLMIDRYVVRLSSVPVALDPAGRQPGGLRSARGRDLGSIRGAIDLVVHEAKQFEALNLERMSLDSLAATLVHVAEIHRDATVTRLLRMDEWINPIDAARAQLRAVLSRWTDEPVKLEDLEAGIDHDTHRMMLALADLVRQRDHGDEVEFAHYLDLFIDHYGHFESGNETIYAQQDAYRAYVRALDSAALTDNDRDGFERSRSALRSAIGTTEDLHVFDDALARLRDHLLLRENSKSRIPKLKIEIEKLLRRIGAVLAASDQLERPEDVHLLTRVELEAIAHGNCGPTLTLLELRRCLIEWKSGTSWLPHGFLPNGKWVDGTFRGEPGSPGRAEGPARLVEGPAEFAQVRPGDVVVARATSPVWTQLFGIAAGIVVENGTLLSHAALTAREHGIPSVVGARGIFDPALDGVRLFVDGTSGWVTRADAS